MRGPPSAAIVITMTDETTLKGKPVVIPASLHQHLKVLAARSGKKLTELVTEKLNELLPATIEFKTAPQAAE